jgi:hypothetical protein
MPNSSNIMGIDHKNKNAIQAIKNSPPPLEAAMRGNRQMFPVPTAMPSIANNMVHLELKKEFLLESFMRSSFVKVCVKLLLLLFLFNRFYGSVLPKY